MKDSLETLTGRGLRFDRTGRRLVVAAPDAIAVVDVVTGGVQYLPYREVRAACPCGDQVWLATGGDQLVRLDLDGRELGEPVALPFAAVARLEPAPCGPPAASWGGGGVTFVDDFGALVRIDPLDRDRDALDRGAFAIPLTGRRHVVARGTQLVLPSGLSADLGQLGVVVDGAVMQDGKAVVVLTAHAGGRQLALVSLSSGQIVQRRAMPAVTTQLANRRGLALARVEPRALWLVDLRTGRELGTIASEHDIEDFAIDPDGVRLVTKSADGSVEIHVIAERLAHQAQIARAGADAAGVAEVPLAAQIAPTIAAAVTSPSPSPSPSAARIAAPLLALSPRVRPAICDRATALAELDRELHGVALRALHAIATAWDTRRLGYGNEGRHPYELEATAILGLGGGFAAEHLAAAREQLAAYERACAADPRHRASDTPVGALIAELGLAPRAVDIMLAVAAASLRGEIARLYGILANDAGRPIVDELVVQQLLGGRYDRHDIAAELDPRAPLVRLGIVHVSTKRARPFAELAVDPVVLDRLRAEPAELGAATTVRAGTCGLAELELADGVLDHAFAQLARPVAGPLGPLRLAVRGQAGCGRRTLLAALAETAGRQLAVIAATALPRAADAFALALARALRGAQLAGLVPCIAELDQLAFEDRTGCELAADVLRAHPGPLAVIASPDMQVPLAAGHVAIELPVLAETARRGVWQRALADAGLAVADIDVLAARYRIGAGVIRRAVAAATADASPTLDATAAIEAFVRQTRDARLGQFARRVDRLASWSSVVLPPDILDSLRELVARVRHRRTVYEDWGMGRTMQTSRGIAALFQGQPGTGKTLVAGVIARELGLDLYQVDLSKVMSKWIGETERNLATIFDAAEDGQVILLFDEADSLFAKRTEVRSSNDRYANLEVNFLLQRLDSFEGIAILTTNSAGSIDPAFKRRMSFRLSFPFPDDETREQLWRAHLPPELPVAGPLVLDALARKYQLSGGYIRNACLRAAFLAAQEETALHQHHLERAVALEFAELGKLSNGGAID